jgi:hypothetical protein
VQLDNKVLTMPSNPDIEMRWVNAWNELYEIIGSRPCVPCQLPDWSVVDIEECKGWLQQSVYEGYLVHLKAGWVGHRNGVIVSRSRPGEPLEDAPNNL